MQTQQHYKQQNISFQIISNIVAENDVISSISVSGGNLF